MAEETPAGPPPITATSYCPRFSSTGGAGALPKAASKAPSRSTSWALPAWRSRSPWRTLGTPWIPNASTSCCTRAPSTVSWWKSGCSTAMMFRACTTSGQFSQVRETMVRRRIGPRKARIRRTIPSSGNFPFPSRLRMARTNEENSCPPGIPRKAIPCSPPPPRTWNAGTSELPPPAGSNRIASDRAATSLSIPANSSCPAWPLSAMRRMTRPVIFVKTSRNCALRFSSSMGFPFLSSLMFRSSRPDRGRASGSSRLGATSRGKPHSGGPRRTGRPAPCGAARPRCGRCRCRGSRRS